MVFLSQPVPLLKKIIKNLWRSLCEVHVYDPPGRIAHGNRFRAWVGVPFRLPSPFLFISLCRFPTTKPIYSLLSLYSAIILDCYPICSPTRSRNGALNGYLAQFVYLCSCGSMCVWAGTAPLIDILYK